MGSNPLLSTIENYILGIAEYFYFFKFKKGCLRHPYKSFDFDSLKEEVDILHIVVKSET